jgi:hypothetical protein
MPKKNVHGNLKKSKMFEISFHIKEIDSTHLGLGGLSVTFAPLHCIFIAFYIHIT